MALRGSEPARVRRIAAVVPTLGRSPLLAEALRALEQQRSARLAVDVLVIVQGNAPVPGGDRRVIRASRPLGFAAATNLGIASAWTMGEPDFFATVNDDVVVQPGWAEELAAGLEAHPRAAAAQGVNLLGRESSPSATAAVTTDGCGLAWNRWWQATQLGHGAPPPSPGDPPREVFGVSATAALYRSSPLRAVAGEVKGGGPFDVGLSSYYEDVDLACRLRARGSTALLVPAARAVHAGSATGGRMPIARWRWIYGNRYLVLARLLGRRFPAELPGIVARDLADLAAALAAGRGRQCLGIFGGWARAAGRLPAWIHRGAPRLPVAELERFRVESGE